MLQKHYACYACIMLVFLFVNFGRHSDSEKILVRKQRLSDMFSARETIHTDKYGDNGY